MQRNKTISEDFDLELSQKRVTVRVRRRPGTKNFSLRLGHVESEVYLTLPPRARLSRAQEFVARHRHWLETRLRTRPVTVPFADGHVIPIRGVLHRLVHDPHHKELIRRMEVDGMPCIGVSGKAGHMARRLTEWLKQQARQDFTSASTGYAQRLGVTFSRITLRDTTSRWGSCSATGGLSYSWRLIFAPPDVLQYLAAHEVAHLREMNHSPRYWALVREIYGEYDAPQRWLRRHGAQLHGYGRE